MRLLKGELHTTVDDDSSAKLEGPVSSKGGAAYMS